MKINAVELKGLIKRLSTVRTDQIILTHGGIFAMDQDIAISVASAKFGGFRTDTSVNSRKFSSVVNRMSGEIEILANDASVTLKSAKAKVEIDHKPAQKRAFVRPAQLIDLPLGLVKDALKYVSSAANPNKAAATGGAVQFETYTTGIFDDEEIAGFEAMGTDDARCAFTKVETKLDKTFKYSIPLPAVTALQGMEGDTLGIGEAGSYYFLNSGNTTIYANKLAKTFPDYKSFVPRKFKFSATLDAAEFKRVLYTVEPLTQEEEKYGIVVHFLDGVLNIKTVGAGGAAEDETSYAVDPLSGLSEFKAKLNLKFVLDFVSSVSGEIVFGANTDKQPILLEAGDRKLLLSTVGGGS